MSIDVANESGIAADEAALAQLARYVLDAMRVHPLAELSIVLVDEAPMADLHVRWMDEQGPTDVMAFPMDEIRPGASPRDSEPGLLGDVIICPQVAERQAAKAGHETQDEVNLLCTHGVLHLLGYDHAEPEDHKEMFGLQAELLAGFVNGAVGSSGAEEKEDTS